MNTSRVIYAGLATCDHLGSQTLKYKFLDGNSRNKRLDKLFHVLYIQYVAFPWQSRSPLADIA